MSRASVSARRGFKMGCVACAPVEGVAAATAPLAASMSSLDMAHVVGPIIRGPPLPPFYSEPYIQHIYDNIRSSPHRVFLIDAEDGREWRYGELLERARCWAKWLNSHGLSKGAVVGIAGDNSIDTFSVILGTWISGAAANPFNFNFNPSDIKVMFEVSNPDVIYCTKHLERIEKAIEGLGTPVPIVTSGNSTGTHTGFSDILKMDTSDFELEPVDSQNHVMSIMFTSGTTGIPKGITIPDVNLKVFTVSGFLNYEPLMVTSPIFWVSNLMAFTFIIHGLKRMIVPKRGWTNRDLLETIQTYKPESWFTGHAVVLEMAQASYIREYDISSLKYVVTGGTLLLAIQRHVINKAVFDNKLFIKHLYGSTEVGIITNWPDFLDVESDEYNSVGCLASDVLLKIVDSNGELLGPHEHGEIIVKSRSMTPCYYSKNRVKVQPTDDEGWYSTGDKGYYDEKGLIYVIGRIKDILKYRGVQIAPVELEAVMDAHPDILESCAVGKADLIDGDVPVVFVVLKQGSAVTENDLLQYVEENIAEMKRPKEVHIIQALPKSAVGKVLRANLEDMLAQAS